MDEHDLVGADFVARTTITNAAGEVMAAPGESCARVNPVSLPWLLRDGHIAPWPEPVSSPAAEEGR
jgi:hypothetical protein